MPLKPLTGQKSDRARRRRKIARADDGRFGAGPRVDLSPWRDRLGTLTDAQIAREAGVSRSTVQRFRASLRKPPARPERRYTAEEDAIILSRLPPRKIAVILSISSRAVDLRRQWLKSRR